MNFIKTAASLLLPVSMSAMLAFSPASFAETEAPDAENKSSEVKSSEVKTLEGLLKQVKQFQQQENKLNIQREAKFKQNKQDQKALLKTAKTELKAEQKTADNLKASFDQNEKRLAQKEDQLRLRIGNLGEMFGVVRQVADDLNGTLHTSITRAEKPKGKSIRLSHRRIYILPTLQGLGFVALIVLLLLIAFVYNNNLAYLLAFLLASIFFITILHSFKSIAGLILTQGHSQPV